MPRYIEANIPQHLSLRVHHCKEPVCDEFHYNGVTIARLYDKRTRKQVSEGVAYCNLDKDAPSRKIGRAIAIGRALKEVDKRALQVVRRTA